MAPVFAWAIAGEDIDLVDLAVVEGEVRVSLNEVLYGTAMLSPKQARELARDLNAAAKAASAK